MNHEATDAELFAHLADRIGSTHLRQRLGIERDHHAWKFGQGSKFFHIEHWYSFPGLIRLSLRLSGLYGRARRNALDIQITHHEFRLPQLPAAFDGFTILQLSDLHLDMNAEFPHVLAERVRDLDYDICVLTGDFRYRTFGPSDETLDGLRRVRANLRESVYGILGNHDSIRTVPAMEAMDIRMLLNEAVALTRGQDRIFLAGVDDPHYYAADNLDRTRQAVYDNHLAVLLSHSPELYQRAAHTGFDVMLSGHTHGGQICLPGGIPILTDADCPRRFCAGPWTYHQLQGYTSRGAGSSIVDLRLNNRPEITLHRLRRAEAGS
jgi:hypothetical protein